MATTHPERLFLRNVRIGRGEGASVQRPSTQHENLLALHHAHSGVMPGVRVPFVSAAEYAHHRDTLRAFARRVR